MGNCIVTKLAQSVTGSFPTLNTAFLDYDGSLGSESIILMIATASTGSVTLTFSTPFHKGSVSGASISTITVPASTKITIFGIQSELGSSAISKLVKIENIYNLKGLVAYGRCLNVSYTDVSKGLNSVLDYAPIEMYGGTFDNLQVVPNKRFVLIAANGDSGYNYTVEGAFDECEQLEGLNVARNAWNNYGPVVGLSVALGDSASVKVIYGIRLNGNCVNLPINIKAVHVNTAMLSGNIEDFVAKARTNGRTSGAVALIAPAAASNLKYNNTAISTQINNSTIAYDSTNSVTYLTWDATTITFTATKPAELNDYFPVNPSPWTWSENNLVL